MVQDPSSKQSIINATKSRATFSTHGKGSLGAAGFISPYDDQQTANFLSKPGQTAIVNPTKEGIKDFEIGVAWDNVKDALTKPKDQKGIFDKIKDKISPDRNADLMPSVETKHARTYSKRRADGVDLDIGCLYELKNGKRGAIQAFGKMFGAHDEEPFIHLSGDERTGEAEGEDELIKVNGKKWDQIERIIIYIYIYGGADNWEKIQPQIQVRVPEEKPMIVSLHAKREEMALCAVAGLENVRGGIKMTNYLEYFPGHTAMDNAFGFGLEWEEGQK